MLADVYQNKQQIDEAVRMMAQSEGWEYLKDHLIVNIDSLRSTLEDQKFNDLSEVIAIQKEIAVYRKVISFVEKREKSTKE